MARSRHASPASPARLWGLLGLVAIWSAYEVMAEPEAVGERLEAGPPSEASSLAAAAPAEAARGPPAADPGEGSPSRSARPRVASPPIGTAAGPAPPDSPITVEPEAGPEPLPPLPTVSAPVTRQAVPPRRVGRREPIEPPVVERDAWVESILSVTINGEKVSEGVIFAENPVDHSLYVELAAAEAWRLRIDPLRTITLQGVPYYPLAAITSAEIEVDSAELALSLRLPPEAFVPFSLDEAASGPPPAQTGTGGYIDYDLLVSDGDRLERRLDGLMEIGAFAGAGTALTSLRFDDFASAPKVVRLDTTLSRDLPSRRASLRLGDSLTVGGAFARGVRFAGIQYATNFATDPSFVTFPLPAIGGLAEQRSVVDVLVDNLQRARGEVPAGPFSIENLPAVTGAGEVQLKVTDLLGRERIVTQPYYVSSRILKRGLSDIAYEAGFERDGFGLESFDYGAPLASATYRYGLTGALTGEGHVELQPSLQSAVIGGSALLGGWGVLSTGLGGSLDEGNPGSMAELAYEYDGDGFNVGGRTRFESASFAQLGNDEPARRVDQLTLGLGLGELGRVGILFLHRDAYGGDDASSLAGTWSLGFGPGSLSLRAAQTLSPDHEVAMTAAYSVPLGPTSSLASELDRSGGEHRSRLQFRQFRGATDLGTDARVAIEGTGEGLGADARLSHQTSVGAAEIEVEREDGATAARAGVNGTLALVDGRVEASRRVGRAFGLVDLPGYPNVRVYVDNREAGRTDRDGQLLLPGLRPYEANRIRLEPEDLPLDAQVAALEVTAVPFERSGVVVPLTVERSRQATATLHDRDGSPLASGLILKSEDGGTTVTVGRRGFAQLDGLTAEPREVAGGGGPTAVRCLLPALAEDELLPDLGTIRCE